MWILCRAQTMKNNEKVFINVVCCSRDWHYKVKRSSVWHIRDTLLESMGQGGPRWLGSSWLTGIAESGSSQLSTLMIETPGDLVWDLPCVQQASYLEGGPLFWILPLYLHINKKSDDDDDDWDQYVYSCTLHFFFFFVGVGHSLSFYAFLPNRVYPKGKNFLLE